MRRQENVRCSFITVLLEQNLRQKIFLSKKLYKYVFTRTTKKIGFDKSSHVGEIVNLRAFFVYFFSLNFFSKNFFFWFL